MTITTNWKSDGTLVISCGADSIEIPVGQLITKATQGGNSGTGIVFPVVTKGNPKVIANIVEASVKLHDLPSAATYEELAHIIGQARGTSKELKVLWNSYDDVQIDAVKALVQDVSVELIPMTTLRNIE